MEFKNNYEVVPIDVLPEKDGEYFTAWKGHPTYERKEFSDGVWLTRFPNMMTGWLREIPSSVVLTEDEIEKIIEDAFDECDKYKSWVTDSELEQKKKEYIEQFFKTLKP